MVKNPPANTGDKRDTVLIPGSGRFPGVGNGNPFQYSCLENSMDRGALQAAVHGVTKSWTCEHARVHTHTHTHTRLLSILYKIHLLPIPQVGVMEGEDTNSFWQIS